jgi:hypothetical protein
VLQDEGSPFNVTVSSNNAVIQIDSTAKAKEHKFHVVTTLVRYPSIFDTSMQTLTLWKLINPDPYFKIA